MRIVFFWSRLASSRRGRRIAVLAAALASIVCLAGYHFAPAAANLSPDTARAEDGMGRPPIEPASALQKTSLQLPREKVESLQVVTEPVRRSPRPRRFRVPGRLEVHGSRVARVHSLTEGVVREICVEVGDTVAAGQVVAYLDSREVGEAKLALVKERLNLQVAREKHQWDKSLHDNVLALLAAMEKGIGPERIETQFQDRPLGTYREQLVAAMARAKRATADYTRLQSLGQQGAIPEKQVLHTLMERDSAMAAFRTLREQARFEVQQQLRIAQQRLQEAEAAAAIARSQLLILGYDEATIDAMNPLGEGDRVARYPLRAPLAGTVIARPALLSQHVDEATTLVELADLSTLWLRADIFEKDLPSIARLEGVSLRFRTASYPKQVFIATVLSVGHQVSDQTRAVRLVAAADNAQRLLKPGMFADVELDTPRETAALEVPAAAIQHHDGVAFAFVAGNGGHFTRRDLRLGQSTATTVEILAGLDEGEQVVTRGAFAMKSELLSELLTE